MSPIVPIAVSLAIIHVELLLTAVKLVVLQLLMVSARVAPKIVTGAHILTTGTFS